MYAVTPIAVHSEENKGQPDKAEPLSNNYFTYTNHSKGLSFIDEGLTVLKGV